jgi:hypothetical protein
MISVIEHGASTVEGIRTIVAANLGITGDDPRALQARAGIRVVEFWPQPIDLVPIMPDIDPAIPIDGGLLLGEVFELCNPNLVDSHDGGDQEMHIHIHPSLSAPISNLRLVQRANGIFWHYKGTLQPSDLLTLFRRRDDEAVLTDFVDTLQRAADPVSRALTTQFRPVTLRLLHAYDPVGPPGTARTALVEALIADLNAIITGAPLYQADHVASVSLSPDIQEMLREMLRQLRLLQRAQIVWLNGRQVDPSQWEGTIPTVPPGRSRWRFDQAATDRDLDPQRSRFSSVERPLARFAAAATPAAGGLFAVGEIAIAALRVRIPRLTPGTFTVRIPWDIPGYTDRYAEFDDHPRHRMRYVVDKVKAAGVRAAMVYEKTFEAETHEVVEHALRARATWTHAIAHDLDEHLRPLTATWKMAEAHEQSDPGFARLAWHSTEALLADDSLGWQVDTDRIEHEMTDTLAISGVFSHTRFDQSIFLR